MALWGATAGVATLVGPILGGVLVDGLGWEWIFFINVPVGAGRASSLAWRLVPTLPTNNHQLRLAGRRAQRRRHVPAGLRHPGGPPVRLERRRLALRSSPASWCSRLFVLWQARNTREPLVPLGLFEDRNFSLANVAISAMGFAITAMAIPIMIWAQVVRGWSPTRVGAAAGADGGDDDRAGPPRRRASPTGCTRACSPSFGFTAIIASLVWLSSRMTPDSAVWTVLLPMVLLGIGNAFVWAPNSATATRNLPIQQAGAGAGVYNATRQVGAVLGLGRDRGAHRLPARRRRGSRRSAARAAAPVQPAGSVAEKFSDAMAPDDAAPAGGPAARPVAVLFFERPRHAGLRAARRPRRPSACRAPARSREAR